MSGRIRMSVESKATNRPIKFHVAILVLALAGSVLSCAQGKWASVDKHFALWNRSDSPGAAIAIVQNGAIIYKRGYGFANIEYDIRITPSTPFNIASVAKQFTAMAIIMLAEQGKLALDDDYRKFIPEVPDYGKKITIRHLLNHTSGLRSWTSLLPIAGWRNLEDTITREDVFEMICRQKELDFPPGESYRYSNTGYFLLAEIVTRVTDMPFCEFLNKNIFRPLGMSNSRCRDDYEMMIKNRAYAYKQDDSGHYKKVVEANGVVGSGNIFSTAEDLAKWIIHLEELKSANEGILIQMLKRGLMNDGREIEYGFGFYIDTYRGQPVIRHAGGSAGFASEVLWFPKQHFAVIILSNIDDIEATGVAKMIADNYISDSFEGVSEGESHSGFPMNSLDPDNLRLYVGIYKHSSGMKMKVYIEDNSLIVNVPGWGPTNMRPLSETLFYVHSGPQKFFFQKNDSGTYDLVLLQDGKEYVFLRMEVFKPSLASLEEYAGEYYSEELQTTYHLVVRNNTLIAAHLKNEDVILIPEDKDEFSSDLWWFRSIRFDRNANDEIVGFQMDGFRATNLKFVKR
jgi:CubicO group peptidase (beta-lactamase class C family)